MAETIKLVQLLKMCTTLWYSTLKVYQQLYLQLCQELLAEHCLGQRKLLIAASR